MFPRTELALALLLVAMVACSKDSPTTQAEPSSTTESSPTTVASSSGARSAVQPIGSQPLPADIVPVVNAIFEARTPEEAAAATKIALERSGVVVTEDPAKGPRAPSGLYVPPVLVLAMAEEAQLRATLSRVTFREFAASFAGAAGIPSPVAPKARAFDQTPASATAPEDRDPNAPRAGKPEAYVTDQPQRLAEFVTRWVNASASVHGRVGERGVPITSAPLILAALAQRQEPPVDLGSPFLPDEWRLGPLDTTILIAGLRSAIAASGQAPRGAIAPAVPSTLPTSLPMQAAGDPCDDLKNWMDSFAPQLIDALGTGAGEVLEAHIASILEGFGANAAAAQVGTISNVLAILFRIQTLALLYSETTARTIVTPRNTHKPVGTEQLAAANLEVGIRDGRWEQFRRDQRDSPVLDLLRRCGRLLGVPVPSTLGDIGDAMKNWRVAWSIPMGSGHVQECHRAGARTDGIEHGVAECGHQRGHVLG